MQLKYRWVVMTSLSTSWVLHTDMVLNSHRNAKRSFCTTLIPPEGRPLAVRRVHPISWRNIPPFWNYGRNRTAELCYHTCPWRCVKRTRLIGRFISRNRAKNVTCNTRNVHQAESFWCLWTCRQSPRTSCQCRIPYRTVRREKTPWRRSRTVSSRHLGPWSFTFGFYRKSSLVDTRKVRPRPASSNDDSMDQNILHWYATIPRQPPQRLVPHSKRDVREYNFRNHRTFKTSATDRLTLLPNALSAWICDNAQSASETSVSHVKRDRQIGLFFVVNARYC